MATIQKSKQHILTAVDYEILTLVCEYHFLTVSQVTRLRYSSGSETTCQDRLKRLFNFGVLDRVQLPHTGKGNSEYLYTISSKGFKELQPFGISNFTRYRPVDTHTLKLPHLQHLLTLNDFLIAARLLCCVNRDIRLISMKHDLDMKRTPMRVTLDRQEVSIVPDGFLDFRLSIAGRLYAMPVWVEIDRGTEWGNTLKLKLQKIIHAVQSLAFQELFGVSSVTVAIATTHQKRVDLMGSFIQAELQRLGLLHLSNVFLFTPLPEKVEPITLFTAPVWQTLPGDHVSLLDLSVE
ncbi:MAG TPA: replication-relaxation family protein [Methylomirabilota bacterium]|nr:replication-relaxation family protein [Methylomirabilota bacterium]